MGSKASKASEFDEYHLNPNDKTLCKSSYPLLDVGHTFTLKDQRKLGYNVCGAVENYKVTIVLFPGSPGTRLFNHAPHDMINKSYGIRVIVLDRPGIGLSSSHPEFTFSSYAHDVNQLVQHLKLDTYHIVGYSAGGPFACHYAVMYSSGQYPNKLKSVSLIASVGPPQCRNVYRQQNFQGKVGWFIVRHGSRRVIDVAVAASSKKDDKTPIKTLVDDMSLGEYDKHMIRHNPAIIKSFLMSSFETETTDVHETSKSENRTLELYGTPWQVKLEDIDEQCKLFVYNGTKDVACVPNMAKYIFECATSSKAPSIPLNAKSEAKKQSDQASGPQKVVELKEDEDCFGFTDEEKDQRNEEEFVCKEMNAQILEQLNSEYEQDDQQNVKHKHSKLSWGVDKGHLWFFENDLWINVVHRALFWEQN